ncbi:hypothetical protein BC936DRAFT_147599, partial [Jimgerdemannia flammicorona]
MIEEKKHTVFNIGENFNIGRGVRGRLCWANRKREKGLSCWVQYVQRPVALQQHQERWRIEEVSVTPRKVVYWEDECCWEDGDVGEGNTKEGDDRDAGVEDTKKGRRTGTLVRETLRKAVYQKRVDVYERWVSGVGNIIDEEGEKIP